MDESSRNRKLLFATTWPFTDKCSKPLRESSPNGTLASCSSPRPARIPALPFCHSRFSSPRPKSPNYPNILKTLGDHLRKRRLDLGLLQKQVAEQIGGNALTICNWEGNKSSPFIRYIPKIIRFLGYNPFPAGGTLPERLTTARKVLGLSQKELAKSLRVDPTTVRGWEAGRHKPIRRCLEIIGSVLCKV